MFAAITSSYSSARSEVEMAACFEVSTRSNNRQGAR
jgi:hypothetical protein